MTNGQQENISPRRRRGRWQRRSQSRPSGSTSPRPCSSEKTNAKRAVDEPEVVPSPRPYMKQVKLHPSGCQQWASQIVTGGGFYMAYASTLTTYIYDVRDYSLVALLGGNECNVHSLLWHPHNPYRLLVLSIDGNGSEWDIRTEERVLDYQVGAPPACSAWDPSDQSNLVVVSKETNTVHFLRKDESRKRGGFLKGYRRRTGEDSLASTCTKWSRHQRGIVVVGWTDGRVSFTEVSTCAGEGKTKLVFPCADVGSVVDLRHDPNGGAYLLVAYSSGSVVLWDTSGHSFLAKFDRCAVGLVGVRWMAWAPGNFMALRANSKHGDFYLVLDADAVEFLTVNSSKTAVARVFTVSQKHSTRTIRLGETDSGIRDMAWLPAQGTAAPTNHFSFGPRAICGFRDGSLSVADAAYGERRADSFKGVFGEGGSGAIPWTSKAGHIETVFGCAHNPKDADTLATCSYGSNVKIWHVPTMDLKITLDGQTGAIYNVAWSNDGDRIASSSGEGAVWIWDVECGKVEQRFHLHSRAVHRVEWDPHSKDRLASAGADRSDTGVVERVYAHPGPLFGCHWCPDHKDVIATACRDGNVRVFDLSWKAGVEPQYILSGHSKRVFHVCWSPLLSGTLASGSDDCTVMVWILGAGALPRSTPAGSRHQIIPKAVLRGHTGYVRPLYWNSEVPWLLLSGSWDGTVRAWDIRRTRPGWSNEAALGGGSGVTPHDFDERGACIAVMSDHVADVYGLSAGLERPFLYVSVSRDTTIRQFTIEGVVSSIRARAIVGRTLTGGLGNIRDAMLRASPTVLCGGASKSLETQLRDSKRSNGEASMDACRRISNFFWGSDGIDTFWETLLWVVAASAGKPKDVGTTVEESLAARRCWGTSSDPPAGAETKTGATPSLRELPRGLMMVEECVIHRNARRALQWSLAGRLVSLPTFTIQDKRVSRSDRLERAVRLYLVTGDIRSACETLVTLRRWERALALAPGVGTVYWRELANRFVEVLLAGGVQNNQCGVGEGGCRPGGTDATVLATSILISAGRPLQAADVLDGSDEALTLAVSVMDGAHPTPTPARASSRQCSEPVVAEAKARRKFGHLAVLDDIKRKARNGAQSATMNVSETKLLSLQNQYTAGIVDACREVTIESRGSDNAPENEGNERKIQFPECDRANGHEAKWTESPPEDPSEYQIASAFESRIPQAAAQRRRAETALRTMTQSRAEAYFRASQPVIAAAAALSVCDGSRTSAAPAVSYLLQGDEPELAFAAARLLCFPQRELRPLVCEMARRAEAWGDSDLAVELLVDAGGDDDDAASEQAAYGNPNESTTAEVGYWPINWYGTGGERFGLRGAAQVASRCRGGARDIPRTSLSCRSTASYLEDAGSSARRGLWVEAVRLLVLGGDLAQASVRGVSFLQHTLSSPSLPPGSLKPMLAVTRALGSGPSLANHLPQLLRADVLAYSSYIGALEAVARGYRPLVVPLLRNVSTCVKMATKLRGANSAVSAIDGKQACGAEDMRSPNSRDDGACAERVPSTSEAFPYCMSLAELEAATIHWLTTESTDCRGYGAESFRESRMGQAGKTARSGQVGKAEDMLLGEAKALDHLLACAKLASYKRGILGRRTSARTGPDATEDEVGSRYGKEEASHTLPYSSESYHKGNSAWAGTLGEIVVGGSRLPNCRRHERTAWGNAPSRSKPAFHRPCPAAGFAREKCSAEKGATFTLEDGVTTMGLSNAVMWAKVNPFSPLNTGQRIMPF